MNTITMTMTAITITPTINQKKSSHGVGCLELNRPAALNALDLPMIEAIRAFLDDCARDPAVRSVLITGNGDKAFCAGGDVKKVTTETEAYGRRFFELEYGTDLEIHRFPKPVTVIAQGITMGGGLGLLAGGWMRVLTDDAVLAMPEVSIGFFTDVGATWFLNRAPGQAGVFLGMTGARFGAWDALYLGLADAVIARADLAEAEKAAEEGELGAWLGGHALSGKPVTDSGRRLDSGKPVASSGQSAPDPGSRALRERSWIFRQQAWIDSLCAGTETEAVYQRLLAAEAPDGEPAIADALASLRDGSPDSARLIHWELLAARGKPVEACFARELELALARMAHPEFREGVRARLIDKDQRPFWGAKSDRRS